MFPYSQSQQRLAAHTLPTTAPQNSNSDSDMEMILSQDSVELSASDSVLVG